MYMAKTDKDCAVRDGLCTQTIDFPVIHKVNLFEATIL